MLEAIEKLLILQDRDRKLQTLTEELAHIPVERQQLTTKAAQAQAQLEAAKLRVKHLESERKKLELDVDAQKQLIEKYSLQQFQTKKNEEYRALSHEIETCKQNISTLDDQQLGGLVMWIPAGVVYIVAALALFAGWMRDSENRVLRREAAAGGVPA